MPESRAAQRAEYDLFAVTAPGLEEACARELAGLGLAAVRVVAGGVAFAGGRRELYVANLWLRTASRVVARVGEIRASDFPELFRRAVRLPWGRFVRPGTRLRVRAVSHRSRLIHTGRIAETVAAAVDRALGRPAPPLSGPEQLVLARFEDDSCLLSVDSSGELLHRRGYREATARAPLRETLAAGLLVLLGWDGAVPLADPMCGSGTLVIEAALLAAHRAPGAKRRFAFMDWPHFRPGLWEVLLAEAACGERRPAVAIYGSDRDPLALAAARGNAGRAGVLTEVALLQADLADLEPVAGPGLILCNPPYGARLGQGEDLRRLYRALGEACRRSYPGWRVAFLAPDDRLAQATGLPAVPRAALNNGGIAVTLWDTGG
jgi:putative N6-adenine-specific DNA methylase